MATITVSTVRIDNEIFVALSIGGIRFVTPALSSEMAIRLCALVARDLGVGRGLQVTDGEQHGEV